MYDHAGEHHGVYLPMTTVDIVPRLLRRPVTPERALKVLHLLENRTQLGELQSVLLHRRDEDGPESEAALAYPILEAALTDPVVARHFATRAR